MQRKQGCLPPPYFSPESVLSSIFPPLSSLILFAQDIGGWLWAEEEEKERRSGMGGGPRKNTAITRLIFVYAAAFSPPSFGDCQKTLFFFLFALGVVVVVVQ